MGQVCGQTVVMRSILRPNPRLWVRNWGFGAGLETTDEIGIAAGRSGRRGVRVFVRICRRCCGFGCWPGVTLGAAAVYLVTGTPWLAALGIAQLPAHRRLLRIRHARERPARLLAIAGAVALQQGHPFLRRRTIMRGQGEVRQTERAGGGGIGTAIAGAIADVRTMGR